MDFNHILRACKDRVHETHGDVLLSVCGAIEHDPGSPTLWYTLAQRCLRCGFVDLWRHANEAALSLRHTTYEDVYLRGQAKIQMDDWTGWADREVRVFSPGEKDLFESDYVQRLRWTRRVWNGTDRLRGKTVFAIADGGYGDCIQMLRYVPRLAELADRVVLAVQPPCFSFVKYNFGAIATVVFRCVAHGIPFDYYTWMMSQPTLHGHLPPFLPLSAPRPSPVPALPTRRRRIAVCWSGHTENSDNRRAATRSLSLEDLGPVLMRDDIQWCSVQVGNAASAADAYPNIERPGPLKSFADTSNVLSSVDGVVTVDTSVAHLAGSMGVPTFVMLPMQSEFRWGMGSRTPWYPTVHLVRQQVPEDWSSAVVLLGAELDMVESQSVDTQRTGTRYSELSQ